jgi:hypothetical protein
MVSEGLAMSSRSCPDVIYTALLTLSLLVLLAAFTLILVDVRLLGLSLHVLVMREFTFVTCAQTTVSKLPSISRVCDIRNMYVPFSQIPALKKAHIIVLGSTPNGTFG